MEPSDKIENYYSTFLNIANSFQRDVEGDDDLSIFYLGYKKGLELSNIPLPKRTKELERLAFRAITSSPFPSLAGRARELFLIGSGFFLALRRAKLISFRQFNRLKGRLERELRREFSNLSKKLHYLFFLSDNNQLQTVRQKAILIKTLRQQGAPFWKEVHSALYQPEKYSKEELENILIKTVEFLEKSGIFFLF